MNHPFLGVTLFFLSVVFQSLPLSLPSRSTAVAQRSLKYASYTKSPMKDTLVVDSSHPTCEQITHHLKKKPKMDWTLRGDSSTDAVMNAIKENHECLQRHEFVATNHFDIDSFLSIWCCVNPKLALIHEETIRECAKIGDFRELTLTSDYQRTALRLACWINSEERRLFYRPFDSKASTMASREDGDDVKFSHFLTMFEDVLWNPEAYKHQWVDEYERVVREYESIAASNVVQTFPQISLVIVSPPLGPGHYYSLFSASCSYDIILACYPQNRYELEIKYTTMVDIISRKTLPRVDLTCLAKKLNELESDYPNKKWIRDSITDSGPLLRLEANDKHLSKAERYGHPFERPIETSSIEPEEFKRLAISFFQFAYKDQLERKDCWTWNEIHQFNKKIDWNKWEC